MLQTILFITLRSIIIFSFMEFILSIYRSYLKYFRKIEIEKSNLIEGFVFFILFSRIKRIEIYTIWYNNYFFRPWMINKVSVLFRNN